jgi:orotidine-5'-phosphate decarboxylase
VAKKRHSRDVEVSVNMHNTDLSERVIVALDLPSFGAAVELMEKLGDMAGSFKVGSQLFASVGPDMIREIKGRDKKLFLDLKFHDIPNTVARASEVATELGVDIFNVHISGGLEMMRDAAHATRAKASELGIERPTILGVTVLTSIDEAGFRRVFNCTISLREQIAQMAKLAQQAGLDGVVASPQEIGLIRNACGEEFVVLTPGVRPEWASSDDQKRTMTPVEAFRAGATYVVIGRPIYRSPDPASALKRILQELEENL